MFESIVDSLFDISSIFGGVLFLILGAALTLGGLVIFLMYLVCIFSIVGYVLHIPRLIFDKDTSIGDTFGIFIISFVVGAGFLSAGTFILGVFSLFLS